MSKFTPSNTHKKAKKMATRNRRGRNIITGQTALGRAKVEAIKKAEKLGVKSKVLDYITQAGSVQQVILVEKDLI